MDYVARYTQGNNSNTIDLALDATSDKEAEAELRKIVEAGFRNETHAHVELSDGRIYGAANKFGSAQGRYI
ncbi:hypothetical protein AACH06_25670 [Ideonella sp. DXS29W]|uniref:Uncharacterized protein n=1 Tax=Ideonella lacteola TaxID=2984193 RepID=A0ABU9BZE5_9BURK